MKKFVPLFLSIVIFLMSVGCPAETEETTKKKKKKAKKTSTSITEVVEDSTPTEKVTTTTEEETTTTVEETTIETTIIETSAETEPPETTSNVEEIPEYVMPTTFQYDNTLVYLNIEYEDVFRKYGEFTDKSGSSSEAVCEYLHLFNLNQNSGIDDLQMTVNNTLDLVKTACDAEYDSGLSSFLSKTSAHQTPDSVSVVGDYSITRADNAFFSFRYESSCTDIEYYNYKVATGEQITINDIVKDMDLFCTLLKTTLSKKTDSPSNLISEAKAGTLNFLLSYDGIYIGDTKISAIANPDVFNLEYFGATPQYYILQEDVNNQIFWDINGDGQTDTLQFEETYDYNEGEFITFTMDINGTRTVITPQELDVAGWHACIEKTYLLCSDSGFYIMNIGSIEDGYGFSDLFKINDDFSVSYDSPCGGDVYYIPYNPEHVVFWNYTNIGGASIEYCERSLLSNGENSNTYHTCTWRRLMQTMKDITGTLCDGSESSVSIPTGTYIVCVGYDLKQELIFFSTLNENEEENILVKFSLDDSGYPELIGNEDPYDIFRGYVRGG